MRIGVVACGYADGYPRHAAPARRCWSTACAPAPSGRVSMDMLAVDLTPVPRRRHRQRSHAVGPGAATASCWPIDEVARAAGTMGYELMCALAQRVPVHVDGG